jgi:sugar phosphate isomerase/epimerase
MVYSGSHIAISGKPDPKALIDYLHAVGGNNVVNSGVLSWDKPGASVFAESIVVLNALGKTLKSEGIHLSYHNHAFEFDHIAGEKNGMDLLLAGLDPAYVDFAFDVAWVWRGKEDPAKYLTKHAARVGYLHLKDTDETTWKEIGRGKLDWDSVMASIAKLPSVRFMAVEQDQTYDTDPLESLRISRAFLKRYL